MKHVLLPELGHYAHFMHRDKMHNPYPLRKIGHKKPFVPPVTQLPVDSTNNGAVSCPIDGNDTLGDCGEAMSCFKAGTLIRMADGTSKAIENIKVLDKVVTAEGNDSHVTGTMVRHHEGEMVRIIAWGHSHLYCTPEHPILTRRGYVEAKKLKKRDWLVLPAYEINRISSIKVKDYVTKEKLYYVEAKGYISKQPQLMSKMNYAMEDFNRNIKLTPGFGRIIGLFLAEGSTNQNTVRWTFNMDEEDTLVAELIKLLYDELGIHATYSIRYGKGSIDVTVCSKILRILLESLCGKSSLKKTIHADIMGGPQEFLESVLSGWLDGDGNLMHDGESKEGTTCSRYLAQDMFSIMQAINLNPSIVKIKKESMKLAYNNGKKIKSNDKWIIRLWDTKKKENSSSRYNGVSWDKISQKWYAYGNLNGVSQNLGLYDDEDEAGKVAIEWRKNHNILGNGMSFREGNLVYRCVRGIKKENFIGDVFNFSVANAESYVAEGIGVHNCHVFNIFTYGQGKPGFTEVSFNESSLVKQYEKVSGGDNGLNEDEVVNEIEKVGVAGNKEMVITSALDINVNNVAMARWALDNFYTIQMAWSVPDNFIQKFTVNPVTVWPNYMTPDPENGHFTVLSDVGGPNDTLNGINLNGFYRNWTWGGYAWVSPHFVESVQPQCFIVFSPRQFSSETGYDSKGRHITTQAALWAEAGGSPVPTRIIEQFPGVN